MSMQDQTMTCRDCGNEFVFTVGEQQFYAERGLNNPPGRCADCRRAAKAGRGGGGGYSSGGGGGYGNRGGGGGGYGGGGGGGQRQMYSAVCADCGRETEVPFQPTGSRPVYCRDCFQNRPR